jgi:hypothetical protein
MASEQGKVFLVSQAWSTRWRGCEFAESADRFLSSSPLRGRGPRKPRLGWLRSAVFVALAGPGGLAALCASDTRAPSWWVDRRGYWSMRTVLTASGTSIGMCGRSAMDGRSWGPVDRSRSPDCGNRAAGRCSRHRSSTATGRPRFAAQVFDSDRAPPCVAVCDRAGPVTRPFRVAAATSAGPDLCPDRAIFVRCWRRV